MKLTIARKILLGTGFVAIAFIGLAVHSRLSVDRSEAALSDLKRFPELQSLLAQRTVDHYQWVQKLGVDALLFGKEFQGQLDHTKCKFGEWYYATKPPAELAETFAKAEEPHRRLHASARPIVDAIRTGNGDLARTTFKEQTVPALVEVQGVLKQLGDGAQELITKNLGAVIESERRTGHISIAIYAAVLAVLVGGSLAFLVRPMRRKFRALTAVLRDIATGQGDLTRRLEVSGKDEIDGFAGWFNVFAEKLQTLIRQAKGVAADVSEASRGVSGASRKVSDGTREQASALEQTAASLEEITGTVKQSADSAHEANRLANESSDAAQRGGTVVSEAVGAMREINASSRRIADIIATVDEIAFQTNLLALNAAVEAARAGEQGRGFAVVATEVRNLAQRSAAAAKEIKSLIQDSVRKVEAGSELVNRSGTTLQEIVDAVKRVTEIVTEIASGTREQSTGLEQVSRAVSQTDHVVQSNAHESDQLTTTAEGLSTQASQLDALVGGFKVD